MSSRNTQYNEHFYPLADEVRVLSENEWDFQLESTPEWLGFKHENKPFTFKLEDEPLLLSSSCCYAAKKVINPYLKRAFDLKKTQCVGSRIIVGYHATKPENVESIVENNFNWRLAGRNRGFKHGKGVCFSENPSFAQQFCKSLEKRIIKAEFLCCSAEIGHEGDILPRLNSDTSKSPNGNVWVKFEDSDFLPSCVYYWDGSMIHLDRYYEDLNDIYYSSDDSF